MNDPGLNNLLKWGIQNSQVSQDDSSAAVPPPKIDADALRQLLGGAMGPSDAELMVESMNVIDNKDAELEHKLVAFDNFEQLIENLDNANNIQNLKLWDRLVNHLDSDVPDLRMYAAWCCAIAVQNNLNTQERLLIVGAIPTLVRLATEDTEKKVRKKAILALSSAIRNFQPSLDAAVPHLPAEYKPKDDLDANDMDSVDIIINKLRENM